MLRPLLSILYPPTCPMCGQYLGERTKGRNANPICLACLDTLPRTEQAAIRENGTEMTLWGECKSPAAAKKVLHMERAAAFTYFEKEHPIQHTIHLMKYADRPEIGWQLAREAAKEFLYADFFEGIDLIIPVPLHRNRLNSRGYNQSEYIARGLSEITGIPIDTTHLTRRRDTAKQAQLKANAQLTNGERLTGRELRKANVEGAFAVNHPEQLYHKHILLVDDLITTGETARACLRAMKQFRGARFSVFALCKAK